MDDVFYSEFGNPKQKWQGLDKNKLRQLLQVGIVADPGKKFKEPLYDFRKILDLFKERYKPTV